MMYNDMAYLWSSTKYIMVYILLDNQLLKTSNQIVVWVQWCVYIIIFIYIYVCVGISMDGFKSLMEPTIKMDDLGVPLAFETSIYIFFLSGDWPISFADCICLWPSLMLETGIPGMERLRDEAMNHTKLRSKKSLEDVEPTQNIEFQNTNGDVNKQTLNKMRKTYN